MGKKALLQPELDWREQLPSMKGGALVHRKRLNPNVLRAGGDVKVESGPVLYWCSRDQRATDNWALLYAAEQAAAAGEPVAVVFNLVPAFLGAGARQFGFMLRGLQELAVTLEARGIPFVLLEGDPKETLPKLVKDTGASLLVTDMSPLRLGRTWKTEVAAAIAVPFHEVDAHNVVPVWEASDKKEVGARTLRARIHRQLGEYLVEYPACPQVVAWPGGRDNLPACADWPAVITRAVSAGKAVPEVSWAVPGEAAARGLLNDFVSQRMRLYESRNDPGTPQGLSGLSPYLHFGQLSAQRAALEATRARGKNPKAVDSFIEEAVVRRELADNFCWYQPQYDQLEGQSYAWATGTLNDHRADKRPYIYSLEKLEQGKTHDTLWNAAQLELVHGGKMHGFMRMYWAKKILEWTTTPEQALEWSIFLNDKYSLDGRDPNGYVGCMWSIVGLHDQGWKEREIFGKIRYMNYDGCKRKFDIGRYERRIKALVDAVQKGESSAAANPGAFKVPASLSVEAAAAASAAVGAGSGNYVAEASAAKAGKTGTKEKGEKAKPKAKPKAKAVASCDAETLLRLVRAATAAAAAGEESRAVDACQAVGRETVTSQQLVDTGAGKELKKLCKHPASAVADAAKVVVKSWQALFE